MGTGLNAGPYATPRVTPSVVSAHWSARRSKCSRSQRRKLMRKVSGVLLTAALVLSAGMVAASPGGAAAAKPTCKTLSGLATFSPPLPKPKAPTKTKPTITIKGAKLAGCIGGGVTGGPLRRRSSCGSAGELLVPAGRAPRRIPGNDHDRLEHQGDFDRQGDVQGCPEEVTSRRFPDRSRRARSRARRSRSSRRSRRSRAAAARPALDVGELQARHGAHGQVTLIAVTRRGLAAFRGEASVARVSFSRFER